MYDLNTFRGLRLAMAFGLGVGLILAAALVALFPQVQTLSNAEITERARALGMSFLTEMPPADQSRAPAPQAPPPGLLTVLVRPGTSVPELAEMLAEGGAVKDRERFVKLAAERGATGTIAAGAHTVSLGDSLEQIVDKLFRPRTP